MKTPIFRQMRRKLRMPLTVLATAIALGSFGCQDKDDADSGDDDANGLAGGDTESSGGRKPNGSGGSSTSSGGSPADGEGGKSDGDEDPLYALAIQVTSASSDGLATMNYLTTTPSLDAGTVLNPKDGVEGTDQLAYGFPRYPAVWMGDGEEGTPVLERWDLVGEEFVPPTVDRTLSFANLGSGDVFGHMLVSPELGFEHLRNTSELHRYNPKTMELSGSLALDPGEWIWGVNTLPSGTHVAFGQTVGWDEDLGTWDFTVNLGFSAFFLNAKGTEIIGEDTWETERWGGYVRGAAADGTTYATLDPNTEDEDFCLMRIREQSMEFDREFGCKPVADLVGVDYINRNEETSLVTWPDAFLIREDRALFVVMGTGEGGYEDVPGIYSWDFESEQAQRIGPPGFQTWGVFLTVEDRVFVLVTTSTDALSRCVTYSENEEPIVDEECVDNINDKETPFYEIVGNEIIPAFRVAAAAKTWSIVRVR